MEVLLSIARGIITIMFVIIGYFVASGYTQQGCINKELKISIDNLNITITKMEVCFTKINERHASLEIRYDEHKGYCEQRFENIKQNNSKTKNRRIKNE